MARQHAVWRLGLARVQQKVLQQVTEAASKQAL
jgi:hypothetical protein